MNRLAPRRPSPALVLSLITLFIAITSTAGALPGRGLVEKGDIAKHAVTSRALARGAVTKRAIAKHAVTSRKLAGHAVVSRTLAPASVGAFALGDRVVASAAIPDADTTAPPDGAWTASATVAAPCPPRSILLGGGVSISDGSPSHQAAVQTTAPNGDRWQGAITTNAGHAAPGTVYAICLL
jgi:hypothetical protein